MSETTRLISAALAGVCIGAGAGYIVANKRLARQFEERLEKETAEMRTFYTSHKKKYSTPEEAVADLIPKEQPKPESPLHVAYHKIVKSERYETPEPKEVPEALVDETLHVNVFQSQPSPDKPYVISQEEFMENDDEHNQVSLTWYADDTLADHRDDIIEDPDQYVGLENLRFGEGSSDENIVHIRNPRLDLDFEIVRSERTYKEDVLGLDESPPTRPSDGP